jgi:2-iminobutanoate/2-iminopropanoate deaminase
MIEAITTASAPLPKGHYSQAVRAGSFVFIAGQLPLDSKGNLVGNDIVGQATQSLCNLRNIVEAAGGRLENVVQCTVYINDIASWQKVDQVYASFFSGVSIPPARAVIPVREMHYGAQIEIQAIAYIDERSS